MSVAEDPRLLAIVAAHPQPLMFATISGAHLYGFASADSDFDLRGVHVLPLEQVIGLKLGKETIERMDDRAGLDLDLVTHDVGKFVRLVQRPNGYVLEQLLSPLVVRSSDHHQELCAIAKTCVTRQHLRHYMGFAQGQWRLFEQDAVPRVKPLLYVYRVLLTGIHLMRTGEVQANLGILNEHARMPQVQDLLEQKRQGAERQPLTVGGGGSLAFHQREFERLQLELRAAAAASPLPDALDESRALALHDFLVRVRLQARAS